MNSPLPLYCQVLPPLSICRTLVMVALVTALGCSSRTVAQDEPAQDEPAQDEPAEGWTVHLSDSFDRDEPRDGLGDDWLAVDGQWMLEQGAMVGRGLVISTRGFPGKERHRTLPGESPPGFIRLEFDVQWPAKSKPAFDAYIHTSAHDEDKPPRQTGYAFALQAGDQPRVTLHREGQQLVSQEFQQELLKPRKVHRIVVENDQGRLRLTIDGQRLLDQEELESFMGEGYDHVGLHFPTQVKLRRVRVLVKQLEDGFI